MDWHRHRDLRLGEFFDRYSGAGVVWAVILALAGVIFYAFVFVEERESVLKIYRLQTSYLTFTETRIDKNGNIVSASNEVVLVERLGILKNLQVSARAVGETYFDTFFYYGERIEEERKTGTVSMVRIPTWRDFLKNLYTWGLVGLWLLLGTLTFLSFAFYSFDADLPSSCLLDLPWQKPWTWIFAALTVPINIPFFAVSAIRIMLHARNEAGRRIAAGEQAQEEWKPDIRWIKPRQADVGALSAGEYAKAKENWIKLRAQMRYEEWQRRIISLREAVEASKINLKDYGQSIIFAQDELAKTMRKLRDVEASEPSFSSELPDIFQVESDFERLLNLSQVARVEVSEKEISVMTHPAIIYIEGQPRDFGSYKITVAVNGGLNGVKVRSVFSTRLDGEGHMYGFGRDGQFCFGSRRGTIHSLLLKGEYLPAIILMLEGLHYVNAGSEQEAAQLYPEVRSVPA